MILFISVTIAQARSHRLSAATGASEKRQEPPVSTGKGSTKIPGLAIRGFELPPYYAFRFQSLERHRAARRGFFATNDVAKRKIAHLETRADPEKRMERDIRRRSFAHAYRHPGTGNDELPVQ